MLASRSQLAVVRPVKRSAAFSSTSSSSAARPLRNGLAQQQRRPLASPCRAIEIDLSDPDTQLSLAGVVFGLLLGIGAPVWYVSRTERDEERLEELRAMNRANFQETGEYLTDEEIAKIRTPK
jgi:hypothetical protein